MTRPRKPLIDLGVYVGVRLLMCVVQALSWPAAIGFARILARLLRHFDRRHASIAEDNVRQSLPELNSTEVARLVDAAYEHLLILMTEIIRIPRVLHAGNTE